MRKDYPTLETYDKTKFDIRNQMLWQYLGKDSDVEIPMGIKFIDREAFRQCKSLEKVTIPEGVEYICERAFSGCVNLTSLTLPNGLKGILQGAFRDCKKLAKINLPETLEVICDGAFMCCSALEEIVIPNNVTAIKPSTFESCKSLVKVTLPQGLEAIERFAFGYCSNLQEINIPDDISEIGVNAFLDCKKLDERKIPKVKSNPITTFKEVESDGNGLKLHFYQDKDYVGRLFVRDLQGMKKNTDLFNYDSVKFLYFLENEDHQKAVKLEVNEGYYGTKTIILTTRDSYMYAKASVTITGPTDWEEDDLDDVMYIHLVEEKSKK